MSRLCFHYLPSNRYVKYNHIMYVITSFIRFIVLCKSYKHLFRIFTTSTRYRNGRIFRRLAFIVVDFDWSKFWQRIWRWRIKAFSDVYSSSFFFLSRFEWAAFRSDLLNDRWDKKSFSSKRDSHRYMKNKSISAPPTKSPIFTKQNSI